MFDNDAGDLPANYGYGGDPSTFAPDGYGASGPTSPAGINLQAGVGQYGVPFVDSLSEHTPQQVHAQPPHRVDAQYGVPFKDSLSEYTPQQVHAQPPHRVDMSYGAASDDAIKRAKSMPTVYSGSSANDINTLRAALGLAKGGWDVALTEKLRAAQAAAGLPAADVTSTELWVFLFGGKSALDAYTSRKGLADVGKSALEGLLSGAQRFVSSQGASAPAAPAPTAPEPTPWGTYALYGVGGIAVLGLGYVGFQALSKKAPATVSNPKRKGKKSRAKAMALLAKVNPFDTKNVLSTRNALLVAGIGLIGYGLYSYTNRG